jgi:hypothetical protein
VLYYQNQGRHHANKSLNIKSPAFVPDNSFSSSNGDLNNTFNSDLLVDSESSFNLGHSSHLTNVQGVSHN